MAGPVTKASHQDGTSMEGPIETGDAHAKRKADQKKGDMNADTSVSAKDPGTLFDSGKVAEQIDALFAGIPNLTEGFSTKAAVIIEGALSERTEIIREALEEQYAVKLEEATTEIAESFFDKLDSYLDYAAKNFMEENAVAIEAGIKSDIAEQVLASVATIIEANGVTIPEDKVDVAAALAEEVQETEKKLNEQIEENIALQEQVKKFEIKEAFAEMSAGMSDGSKEKLAKLTENISYKDVADYKSRVAILKESFGEKKPNTVTEVLIESDQQKTAPVINPRMKAYLAAIQE